VDVAKNLRWKEITKVTSRQNVVRIKEVAIGQLKIGRIVNPKPVKPTRPINVQKLLGEVRKFARQLRIFRRDTLAEEQRLQSEINQLQTQDANLQAQISKLQTQVANLQTQVANLQTELESDVTPNPALQSLLQSKQGQTVTVATPAGNVTGEVILVGTDAVQIQEPNGDIVNIPFAKITAVQ
jgi:predicted RNase H-like nuclease (RuvC/YqgF family)